MARERLRRIAAGEAGNTLLLMPAAVLVLLMLAGVAVDAAVVFLGQRRVADLAASVAQDGVASVDLDQFYEHGELVVREPGAAARRDALLTTLPSDDAFRNPSCAVSVDGVRVTAACQAEVRVIFAGVLPGMPVIRQVEAVETAEGQQGPTG